MASHLDCLTRQQNPMTNRFRHSTHPDWEEFAAESRLVSETIDWDKDDSIPLDGVGTSTTWRKGNVPWNKGKKSPETSKHRKKYWKKWKESGNITQRDIYVGYWSPHHRTDSTTALNKQTLQCPHCGKVANVGNAKRWHFDKCKTKR